MSKRLAKRIIRSLDLGEMRRWNKARKETEPQKDKILAKGRKIKAAHGRVHVAVREAMKLLKAERQSQGLSLSDVEKRSGIGRSALSRLENETELHLIQLW